MTQTYIFLENRWWLVTRKNGKTEMKMETSH